MQLAPTCADAAPAVLAAPSPTGRPICQRPAARAGLRGVKVAMQALCLDASTRVYAQRSRQQQCAAPGEALACCCKPSGPSPPACRPCASSPLTALPPLMPPLDGCSELGICTGAHIGTAQLRVAVRQATAVGQPELTAALLRPRWPRAAACEHGQQHQAHHGRDHRRTPSQRRRRTAGLLLSALVRAAGVRAHRATAATGLG